MKGVILAGGTGSRLNPLTKVTNKHLLPVYNKPMVYYPLYSLKEAGITEVMIVSGRGHAGDFLELLGSGASLGMSLSYEVQEEAGGIAQALSLTERFVGGEKFVVILGDNIIQDDLSTAVADYKKMESGAKIFLKEVDSPESYGVAELDGDKISGIVEKPSEPKSNLAVIGCYMYDSQVFDVIKNLNLSERNELEITDVNNYYLDKGEMSYEVLKGFWGDCGENFDSLMDAAFLVQGSHLAKVDSKLELEGRTHRKLGESDVEVKV
ncbi:NTP transferase domain-containing protein [Candidatus Gracilibacteria bacterium]|nr:NTP transferase domain-containing protein [Candidatus Gracilibacteria bacterium]